jgi:hypothetical protein
MLERGRILEVLRRMSALGESSPARDRRSCTRLRKEDNFFRLATRVNDRLHFAATTFVPGVGIFPYARLHLTNLETVHRPGVA